jgi:hypothetical protein
METADETDNAEERHEWAGIINRKEWIEKRGPADNPKIERAGWGVAVPSPGSVCSASSVVNRSVQVTRFGNSEEKNRWSALLFGVDPSDHEILFVIM